MQPSIPMRLNTPQKVFGPDTGPGRGEGAGILLVANRGNLRETVFVGVSLVSVQRFPRNIGECIYWVSTMASHQ